MKRKFVILLLILVPLSIISFRLVNDNYFQIAKNLDIFATMFREVNANYVDEIEPKKLVTVGIDAILESLDPYNDYITEAELEDYQTITTGEYAGIGAVYSVINKKVLITRIHPGHAADRAGIELGDELLKVDGNEVTPENIFSISKVLKGQVNSVTKVEIRKVGTETIETFDITRENIQLKSVTYFGLYNPTTGYIKLEEFTVGAANEVQNAVNELKDKGAEKIILDLRGNGGGLLTEAINISNIFIDKGKEIVATKGKLKELDSVYRAKYDALDATIPLAVLIDNGSASASEVVAGVMQDYDRGVLVGRKTFGKGLVQTTRPLVYNTQLKVTTSKYYIPSGRCIQAIDYATEGHSKIPDSLRIEFKTEAGRPVYDGDGLAPDEPIDPYRYSTLAATLAYRGYLFEYAIKYKLANGGIESARNFSVSDSEYEDFIKWISTEAPQYKLSVEESMDNVESTAKEERYYDDLKKEIDQLKTTIDQQKKRDYITFKKEIVRLLNREIAGVNFHRRGEIESTFNTDRDLQKAVSILADPAQYSSILSN